MKITEAEIKIGGHRLSLGQSMTLRVAVITFYVSLVDEDDDISKAYRLRVAEILQLIKTDMEREHDELET